MRKRTSKFMTAAILTAAIFGADAAGETLLAQSQSGQFYTPFSPFRGWFWPGGYFYGYQQGTQQTAAAGPENAKPAEGEKADEKQTLEDIPQWEPIAPAGPETKMEGRIEPDPDEPEAEPEIYGVAPANPDAAKAIKEVNKARIGCGIPALYADPRLCEECTKHSAYMQSRGFRHAADGGLELIAEGFETPEETVKAWLDSDKHAKLLYGPGTKIGVGVVGNFYTLRITGEAPKTETPKEETKMAEKQKFGTVYTVTEKDTFNGLMQRADIVVIDFSATWCGPCRMLAPQIEKMAEELPEVFFCNADAEKCTSITACAGDIYSLPTVVIYKDGEEVKRVSGYNPAIIRAEIEEAMKEGAE